MRRAEDTHRSIIVDILVITFEDNKSVNYIIQQDAKRTVRIKRLMEYSFTNPTWAFFYLLAYLDIFNFVYSIKYA